MSMVRKAEEPPTIVIDDSDPYVRSLYKADPRDGAAGLRMAYQGDGRERNRRG
jgi:N-formylglutamate amidohydrolase